MCGILGYYTAEKSKINSQKEIEFKKNLQLLDHRGPDNHDLLIRQSEGLMLGHARLSIIDLSENNNQPFIKKSVSLVFNGEIYNYLDLKQELIDLGYEFQTEGDSEVIATGYHKWGRELFRRLKGMYAIALYDSAKKNLYLARDPFGIKPLYVNYSNDQISFSSEIKSVIKSSNLCQEGFSDLITFGYHFGNNTLYEGVNQIEPGELCSITINNNRLDIKSNLIKPIESIAARKSNWDSFEECLIDSVNRHMISDTPVASALSGGLDSSVVTSIASKFNPEILSYTNSFWPEGDNETLHASEVTKYCGLKHRIIYSEIDDLEKELKGLSWHIEEPIVNTAVFNTYSLARGMNKDHFKVVLVGEGSDEIFAGYPWHKLALSKNSNAQIFESLRTQRAIIKDIPKYITRKYRKNLSKRINEQYQIFENVMKADVGSRLNRFLLFDIKHQLVTSQLQRVDRLFMAFGIEARVPFLFDDVLSWSFMQKDSDRLDVSNSVWRRLVRKFNPPPRRDKVCLSIAAKKYLPDIILRRPKFGKTGTVNVGQSPALHQLPILFKKIVENSEYYRSREYLSEWINWDVLSETKLTKREQLFFIMLIFSIRSFILR